MKTSHLALDMWHNNIQDLLFFFNKKCHIMCDIFVALDAAIWIMGCYICSSNVTWLRTPPYGQIVCYSTQTIWHTLVVFSFIRMASWQPPSTDSTSDATSANTRWMNWRSSTIAKEHFWQDKKVLLFGSKIYRNQRWLKTSAQYYMDVASHIVLTP